MSELFAHLSCRGTTSPHSTGPLCGAGVFASEKTDWETQRARVLDRRATSGPWRSTMSAVKASPRADPVRPPYSPQPA
jgi:hypothetical protein